MSTTDDSGLIIEEARNLSDDAIELDDTTMESAGAFDSTMKKQGIAIDAVYSEVNATDKNLDDFSRELLNQGDIEIVSSEGDEEHYE